MAQEKTFKFVFPSTSPNLGRTIKLAKLKRNNAFVKKLVNIRFDLTIYKNHIHMYTYLKNILILDIGLYKLLNSFA